MEELTNITTYAAYKAAVDREVSSQVEGFVRLGYLLKVARDTTILAESGYKSVAEFAQAEYGLTKDIVSRYISINDRFSVDGYSDRLKTEYEGYGLSKLAEMLTLPDCVVDVLSSEMTRKEILEVKAVVKEDEKVSDIEIAIEQSEALISDWKMAAVQNWVDTYPERYHEAVKAPNNKAIHEIVCPTGRSVLMARVKGKGAVAISIKEIDAPVEFVITRINEKEKITFDEFAEMLINTDTLEKPKSGALENKPKTKDDKAETPKNTDTPEKPKSGALENKPKTEDDKTETPINTDTPAELEIEKVVNEMAEYVTQKEWEKIKRAAWRIIELCEQLR